MRARSGPPAVPGPVTSPSIERTLDASPRRRDAALQMKLAQVLLHDAPPRERRLQALDRAALADRVEIVTIPLGAAAAAARLRDALASSGANLAHVYGPPALPADVLGSIPIPVVAAGIARRSIVPWRKARQPDVVLGASAETTIPDAVDDSYFAIASRAMPTSFRIGCAVATTAARAVAEGTQHRIERFRDDIRWMLFGEVPAPEEMSLLNAWIDPEPAGDAADNGVPEALAAGRPVIAAATPANRETLEQGAAGFLVPPRDSNETAHAVLAALFKPELRDPRIARGKQKAESFRRELRAARLLAIYQRLSP